MKEDFRSVEFAPGKVLSIETGRIAKQADGSVIVKMGDTMVLCTAVSAKEPKPGQDFFPLTVDHKESFSAAGRFPGGFMKREGKSNDKEVLSSRLIDRTLRPLFPKGYYNDTQIITSVISSDDENDGDVLGGVGASLALHLSDVPFDGPMAEVRVGRVDGEFIINPTVSELKESDIDMVVGGSADSILMMEGEMQEISEKDMLDAIKAAHEAIKKLCDFQNELREELGKPKREFVPPAVDEELEAKVKSLAQAQINEIVNIGLGKEEYNEKIKEAKQAAIDQLEEEWAEDEDAAEKLGEAKKVLGSIEKNELRSMILEKERRIDGRTPADIRDIWTQVGYIARAHGSSIFTRGETQALVSATLGTKRDEQSVDTLFNQEAKTFYLHYNFPP
ncbi:MAG: polyribonucleotide nucleotidyltransferase, partial [Balneolales bacterium]|nr:polyribonucleotide nucleotidyltransferase [Balneolales bacterium]